MQSRKNAEILQKKFRAALQAVAGIGVFGSSNKIKHIEKTHAWNIFQEHRYKRPSSYLEQKKHPISSEDRGYNAEYQPDLKAESKEFTPIEDDCKLVYKTKRWYFHVKPGYAELKYIPRKQGQDPLEDPQFKLTEDQGYLLKGNMIARAQRVLNCNHRANLIAEYLWQHPEGINKIEVVFLNFDHVLVVVNREGNFGGLYDPSTWGDAWILDGWTEELGNENGIFFHASEYPQRMQQIKQYYVLTTDQTNQLGMQLDSSVDYPRDIQKCDCKIEPAKHPYPVYDAAMSVGDYYIFENEFPDGGYAPVEEGRKKHQVAMRTLFQHYSYKTGHFYRGEVERLTLDDFDDESKAFHFKRIYQAMYDGETTVWKTKSFIADKMSLPDTELMSVAYRYKDKKLSGRTRKALQLMEEFLLSDTSNKEAVLARKIEEYAAAHSGLYSTEKERLLRRERIAAALEKPRGAVSIALVKKC